MPALFFYNKLRINSTTIAGMPKSPVKMQENALIGISVPK